MDVKRKIATLYDVVDIVVRASASKSEELFRPVWPKRFWKVGKFACCVLGQGT